MRRITLITSLVASVLAALAVAVPASATNRGHHYTSVIRSAPVHAKKATNRGDPGAAMANYAAGFMTRGNNVPQGGNRYEPGFAGWASFARGYKASHPEYFPG
jgi:hypothetical protein